LLAVFGLGNPGRRYKGTRHNIGFAVVDALAERAGVGVSRRRFQARVAESHIGSEPVLLAEPQTFMNESGRSVRAALDWYGLDIDNILVVCDDLDLEPGTLRVRRKGSSGGHKGLKSIAQCLGADDFPRLRIGIGRPPGEDAIDYVLTAFAKAEKDTIDQAVETAADAAACWAVEGIDACMNGFNRKG